MRIIFAKHDNGTRELCWAVPDWMDVHKGDFLLVDTKYGKQVATATSNVVEATNADEITKRFGAYIPLRRVLNYCSPELAEYIKNKALVAAAELLAAQVACRTENKGTDLPF